MPDPATAGTGRLIAAIAVNVLLTVVQIIGGVVSGSLSLVADAIHNLSDAAALAVALLARRIAGRPADAAHTFGHGRAEMIGALFNLSWLIFIGLFLVFEAVDRMLDPQPVEGWIVVILAGIALVVDVVTAMMTYALSRDSMNIRAAFIHNVADALASVGVIVAGTLILLYDWYLVDAIVTIAIAGYILWHAGREIPAAVHILMQGTPQDLAIDEVTEGLRAAPGVVDIHHVHLWHIDEHRRSLEAHVVIDPADMERMEAIKAELKQRLADAFDVRHSTLEFEFASDACADPPLGERAGGA